MVVLPADKFLLEDYRSDMRVVDAPQDIETSTPIVPVRVIGAGYPKQNSKQKLHTYYKTHTGAAVFDVNVATVTGALNIFFIGVVFAQDATTGSAGEPQLQDNQATGQLASPQTDAILCSALFAATSAAQLIFFPAYPIKCNSGIHLFFPNQGAGTRSATVYYMEERT